MNINNENSEKEQRKARTDIKKFKNLRFSTLQEARESLAELTIGYVNGEVSEHSLRCATYAINGLGKLLLHEKMDKMEQRLNALEKARK